jgi:hypothetical protein
MIEAKKRAWIKNCFLPSVLLAGFLLPAHFSAAESKNLELTDAFKWYEFGKMNMEIASSVSSPEAGAVLPLSINIKNQTKFPITEGTLYLKIYREKEADKNKDYFKQVPTKEELNDGLALVDQFFAAENLTIDKNGAITLKYDYQIPNDARGGKYKIQAYFQSIRKINLQGLSFTDDVPGCTYYFQIKNSRQTGAVEFNRGNVTVNGKLYEFNSFIETYGADEEVKISAQISNTTDSSQKVALSSDYYSWDGLDEKNNFGHEKADITLAAGEKKKIEFVVPKADHPVTYVTVRADWGGNSHSIFNVRFARGVPVEARINSLGLTQFPLKLDDQANIFVTAHEINSSAGLFMLEKNGMSQEELEKTQPGYKLEAAIEDENGRTLQSYVYEGKLASEVLGFESDFSAKENYNFLVLKAKLTNTLTNKLIDSAAITYYCKNKNFSGCWSNADLSKRESFDIPTGNVSPEKTDQKEKGGGASNKPWVAIIVLIILLAVAFVLKTRKIIIFLILFSGSLLFGIIQTAPVAKAASVSYAPGSIPRPILRMPLYWQVQYKYWWMRVQSLTWNTTYDADATRDIAGTIPLLSGSTLNPGDIFYITDKTHLNASAIFYNMVGGQYDTPYGYFKANADKDVSRWDTLRLSDYGTRASGLWPLEIRMSLSFNTFDPSLPSSSKMIALGGAGSASYNNCTGTSLGTSSETPDASSPITCLPSGTPYIWTCTVNPTAATAGSVKMIYGCTYGALYYKAWWDSMINNTSGSCTDPAQECHYYEGLFQQKLYQAPGSSFFGIPSGTCGLATSADDYSFPGPDGCRGACLPPIGLSECTSLNGTNYEYRPIIPQREIPFNFIISQDNYTVGLEVSKDGSAWGSSVAGDVPLNNVQLRATLTADPTMPAGNADFTFDCGNGTSYVHNGVSVSAGSPYTLPEKCNYGSDGSYTAKVTVTKGGKTHEGTSNVNVSLPVSCGSACINNPVYCLAPEEAGLCSSGAAYSAIDDSDPSKFSWTCTNGSTVSCHVDRRCSTEAVWKEVEEN